MMIKENKYLRYGNIAVYSYPLYLVIFCFQLPLSFLEIYSTYYDSFGLGPAFLFLSVVSLLLFVALRLVLPDTQIAGLGTLTVLILLFPSATLAVPVYLIVVVCGLGSLVLHALRRKRKSDSKILQLPRSFTYVVNVAALAMTIAIGVRGLIYNHKIAEEAVALSEQLYSEMRPSLPVKPPPELPHIVHIVLDGYSRADVLKNVYGFDNSPFLSDLRERGFRISTRATTPYNQTLFVMASITALQPITEAIDPHRLANDDSTLRRVLAHGQQHGTASKILADLGYELQSTPTTYRPLQWDRVVGIDGTVPILHQFRLPGTYVLTHDLLKASPIFKHLNQHLLSNYFDIVAVNYQNLQAVPNRRVRQSTDRPLFVYQHIIAPHPPFNIHADGRARLLNGFPTALSDGSHIFRENNSIRPQYRDGYIDKLQYINGTILTQIDNLMESLSGPTIIILHSDHGGGLYLDQDEKKNTCLKERFSPLLAVYATDHAISNEFTDDFNLVNIYRAIFRVLLDIDLPNLPSHNTFISWELDKTTALNPSELARSCTAHIKASTAGR